MRRAAATIALAAAPALGIAGGAAVAAAPSAPAVTVVAHAAPHAAQHTLADSSSTDGANMFHHG